MRLKLLFALAVAIGFLSISCDNEPLRGDFVVDDPLNIPTDFRAKIDGVQFVADTARAQTKDGVTLISGIRRNGDAIDLRLNGAGLGAFDMITQGEALFGIDVEPQAFSTRNDGGAGRVVVTEYDTENGLISGTFAFTASRRVSGNPPYLLVEVTQGSFTAVPLESDGSEVGDQDPQFFGEVEGEPFVATAPNAGAAFIEATNKLVIQGVDEGNIIQIEVRNPTLGTFNLNAANVNQSKALYRVGDQDPFLTLVEQGGSGTITLTELDFETNMVSGTYSFVAGRNLGKETVTIENGFFNNIPITAGLPAEGEGFMTAFVDGITFSTNEVIVENEEENLVIQAIKTTTGERISFSFPANLETGTYNITFSGPILANYFDGQTTFGTQSGLLILLENGPDFIRFIFNLQTTLEENGKTVHIISEGLFQYNL